MTERASLHSNRHAARADPRSAELRRANRALLTKLGVVVVAMFGFGYALVPFYEKICEVTGLRNIDSADTVANPQVDPARPAGIEVLTNPRNPPGQFRALPPATDVHPRELTAALF